MTTLVQFNAFNFKSSQVRVITDPNQEFWFCGSDVCYILGYKNAPDALAKHCKQGGIAKRYTPTQSGEQEMIFINEPNLYRLIIKSRKPEAEPFEAWVFEEVLPQIRKTGQYSQEQPALPLIDPLKELITREMTTQQWLRIASMWFRLYDCVNTLDKLKYPLEKLGSSYAPHVYSCATEDKITLGVMKRLLAPMFEDIEVPEHEHHYRKVLETLRNYKPTGIGAIAVI